MQKIKTCMASVLRGHSNIIRSSSTGLFLMAIPDRYSHQLIQYDQQSFTLGHLLKNCRMSPTPPTLTGNNNMCYTKTKCWISVGVKLIHVNLNKVRAISPPPQYKLVASLFM